MIRDITLSENTKKIVLGLIKKCKELDLRNVSFYSYENNSGEVNFYIMDRMNYWELRIKKRTKELVRIKRKTKESVSIGEYINFKVTDIYRVDGNKIIYDKSTKESG